VDLYQVLQVRQTASAAEIKRAFRQQVKRYHPDRHRAHKAWAERKFKAVVHAYRTLGNAKERAIYDARWRAQHDARSQGLGAAENAGSPRSQAVQLLRDLVDGKSKEALATFERLSRENGDFDLAILLPERDYLDCMFLLAEQYERARKYKRSLEFYWEVFMEERQHPRLRYFMDELKERIRILCCRFLAPAADAGEALQYYHRVLLLQPNKTERAFVQKKMAECYHQQGKIDEARAALARAFELQPNLKGAHRISQKLGVFPSPT